MGYIGQAPANKAVKTADIEDSAITAAKIADGTVVAGELASDSVTTAKILNANVTTAKLAADAVDGTKLADDAVNSEHYTDGSIDNAHIADDAIDSEHYADGSIDTAHIGNDQIDSQHYAAGSIDLEHMSSESVDEDNLHISNAGSNGEFLSKQSGNAGGLTWAAAGGGKINQVLQTHKADAFTHSNTSYQEISTFRRAITPSASSSKILINAQLNLSMSGSNSMWVRLIRLIGSTETIIAHSSGDGSEDAAFQTGMRGSNPTYEMHNVVINYLDSPSTTSECTYYIVCRVDGNAIYVNRVGATADRAASSNLTAMEVLA